MTNRITIKDLKDGAKISKLSHDTNEPIFVTKNGTDEIVIMSDQYWEDINKIPSLLSVLKEADFEYESGKMLDAFAFLDNLKDKYEI